MLVGREFGVGDPDVDGRVRKHSVHQMLIGRASGVGDPDFDGRVRNLPCTIRRFLFDDFNMTNKDKVFAGVNSEFKEIIWLYPKGNSTEPNAYVIHNVQEQTWGDAGQLSAVGGVAARVPPSVGNTPELCEGVDQRRDVVRQSGQLQRRLPILPAVGPYSAQL